MKYAPLIPLNKSETNNNYLNNFSNQLNRLNTNSDYSNTNTINDDILFPTEVETYLNVTHL